MARAVLIISLPYDMCGTEKSMRLLGATQPDEGCFDDAGTDVQRSVIPTYSMSGPDLAHPPTQHPVLTERISLPAYARTLPCPIEIASSGGGGEGGAPPGPPGRRNGRVAGKGVHARYGAMVLCAVRYRDGNVWTVTLSGLRLRPCHVIKISSYGQQPSRRPSPSRRLLATTSVTTYVQAAPYTVSALSILIQRSALCDVPEISLLWMSGTELGDAANRL
eukprot:2573899-Rhodomonas_salina.5